jgi:quercetin dioxygenase-like cupin family protein
LSTLELVCSYFNAALVLLRGAGLRLELIYPADDPHGAILTDGTTKVRLTSRPDAPEPSGELPPFEPEFVLTRAQQGGGAGRAGMLYRDLVPSRLGGRYIASHITIPEGGPVADWVHFHRIALQALMVARGWVRVVYEDQGEPFVLNEGDLVLQPAGIRHQVLESSAGLEVVEIAAPALHATFADHDMTLPNGRVDPKRDFSGQRFLRHVAAETPWTRFHGGEAQETAMGQATGGLAEVRVVRPAGAPALAVPAHSGELVFGFVLDGAATQRFGEDPRLRRGDAFLIPPGEPWTLEDASPGFRLLYVTTAELDQKDIRSS